MLRLVVWLVAIMFLAPAVAITAPDPEPSAPSQSLPTELPLSPEMITKMMNLWRQMGPDSPLNGPLLKGLTDILQSGGLTPEGQKKLAALGKQLEQMARDNFSPQNPKNQQRYQDLVNELQGLVEGWKHARRAGKDSQ